MRINCLAKSFITVRVVFDRYKTDSLKVRTRVKRTSGKNVRYQVIDSTNICGISLKQLLLYVLTKRDLTVYLSKYLEDTLKILTVNMFYHTKTKCYLCK